jgi:hypothetical protein
MDIIDGVEFQFWTSIFLQMDLQISFGGLNLQVITGVALTS